MEGVTSFFSGDASKRHDHVVGASPGSVYDQLDQFELSLKAELLDYQKMVENLGFLNDDLNNDPEESTDGSKTEESVELESPPSQTRTNEHPCTAVAKPRKVARRLPSRNKLSCGPPQSPAPKATQSSGKSYGGEQKGPPVTTSNSTDAPQTPDHKGKTNRLPGERSSMHSQQVEKSPGRKVENPRTPSASVEGRDRGWQNMREQNQADHQQTNDSLAFHLRSVEGKGRGCQRQPICKEWQNTRELNQANHQPTIDSLPFHLRN